jgi:hypothetical protein
MISKEQMATVMEALATASVVGFGWALGGPVGAGMIAGIGINLSSNILQKGSTHLKEKWISAKHGALNQDIQRALGRALVKALTEIEARYFELPEANIQPSEKKKAIRTLFKELKVEALTIFVTSAEKIVNKEEAKAYLHGEPYAANSKLWERMEGTKLLYSYYGEHFKGFLRDSLSDELIFWFGEELKTDERECNRAWRAFQWLLLEGIQDDVKTVRADQELIRQDLLVLDVIKRRLDELKDTIDRRVSDEPFQQGLEQSLHSMKVLLGTILNTSHRLETKVDILVRRTAVSETKIDTSIEALLSSPPLLVADKHTNRHNRQYTLSNEQKNSLSEVVIKRVEERFHSVNLREFTSELDTFEKEAQRLATQSIFSYLASRFRSLELIGNSFKLGSKRTTFILEVGPKVGSTILEVLLFEESQHPQIYAEVRIPLFGWGRYTEIHLSVLQELYSHTNAIAEVLRVVYLSAYYWLAETLLLKLNDLESQASVALYSALRVAFRIRGNEQLSEVIRFGVLVDGRLFYLVDRQTCVFLGAVLSKRKFWSTTSPALSLLNLLGFPLGYEDSFSRHAINQQAQLDFTLTKATYITENPEYLRAEREMVSGNKISVFVISTGKMIKLVANFPTSKKRDIIPVLKAHKDQLSMIFERDLDQIIKSTEVLMANFESVNWASAGGFVGGLAGDLLKNRKR